MSRYRRPWRPSAMTWCIALVALLGLGALLYPSVAQWVSAYNQSRIVNTYADQVADADPDAAEQLARARAYNDALSSGAVLAADARLPSGTGIAAGLEAEYDSLLRVNSQGMMARLRYDSIGVDLAVYHGTSDETLLRGAGHLEGTSLPVGGTNSHAVITAHRGLATAAMFTALDRAEAGDVFTVETFGELLSYRVRDVRIVEPDSTDTLRAVPGEDLVTLVTCTPLGINSHRILVTGERIGGDPAANPHVLGQESTLPGFPWWAVALLAGLLAIDVFVVFAGFGDARTRRMNAADTGQRVTRRGSRTLNP